jgi:hypothetical protein
LPQQDFADDVRGLTTSIKIAAVPALPAGNRFETSSSSSFTQTTNGIDWTPFGVTASSEV